MIEYHDLVKLAERSGVFEADFVTQELRKIQELNKYAL